MQIKLSQHGQETLRQFDKDEIIVGRPNPYATPDLDLTPDATVSRTHARIWKTGRQFWIEDLNSRYGTLVNHVKLNYQRELQPDDVIQIGETTIRVDIPAQTVTATDVPSSQNVPDLEVEQAINAEDTSLTAIAADHQGRLAMLLELPAQFGSVQKPEQLLPLVLQRVGQVIPGAVRGAILLHDAESGQLVVKASISEEPAVSEALVHRALTEGRGFIWRRLIDGISSESLRRLGSKTGMYVPLLWKNRVLGVICVDNPLRDFVFNADDLRLLMAVAHYAGMTIVNHQLEKELLEKNQLIEELRLQAPPKRRKGKPAA